MFSFNIVQLTWNAKIDRVLIWDTGRLPFVGNKVPIKPDSVYNLTTDTFQNKIMHLNVGVNI